MSPPLRGGLVTVHARGILALFCAIMDFMCWDGHGFAEGGRAKATEANIVEVGPPPFGCAESTEGEKGGTTVTIR